MGSFSTEEITKAAGNLDTPILTSILDALGKPSTGKKEDLVTRFEAELMDRGLTEFIRVTEVSADKLTDLPEEKRGKKKAFKILQYLSTCSEDELKSFSGKLGLPDDMTKLELEVQIADEVMLMGTKQAFDALKLTLLKRIAEQVGVSSANKLASKELAIDKIMSSIFALANKEEGEDGAAAASTKSRRKGAAPPPASKKGKGKSKKGPSGGDAEESAGDDAGKGKKKEKKEKKEKAALDGWHPGVKYVSPPLSNIKKGVTYTNLYDEYNLDDLREYCRLEGLSTQGKKRLIIQRIVTYLDSGDKPERTTGKKRKRNKESVFGTKKTRPVKRRKTEEGGAVDAKK